MGFGSFVGNITGGLLGESDAEQAAKDAKRLSEKTTKKNIADFEEYFGITEDEFQPYLQAGAQAISDLMDQRFGDPEAPELASFAYPNPESPELDVFKYATPESPELQQFVFDATQLGGTEAYQFRYGEGLRAAERLVSANRGVVGPNAAQALMKYGQGMASQEYENEWQRQLTTNLTENERRISQYGLESNQFDQERQRWMDENSRRIQGNELDVSRYGRAFGANEYENSRRLAQYGAESDRYRGVMDRLFGLAGQGQTATTNLGAMRQQTVGNIAGARGQNAASQFAASLIPVQEKSQFIGGLMDLGGTVLGAKYGAKAGAKK